MMDTELLNMLLVEVNPDNTDLIQEFLGELTTFQFNLHVADRLSSGLNHLANDHPDIVLLDLDLPDSQGLETLDRVRAAAPEVAVIVLIGSENEATGLEALHRGAQDYLVKGQLDGNLLRRSIRYALQLQHHRQLEDLIEERTAALRQSEQNLARAQSIAHLGSWDWDIVGQTLTWSDELYRIFGVSKETFELTYDNIANMIHPDDREKNNTMVQELLATANQLSFEFRIIRSDNSIRHIHQTAQVMRGAAGEAQRAFGIMVDITERKQAEEALHESEQFVRSTLDGLSAHIAIVDQTGNILAVNQAWRDFADANLPVASNVCEGANYLDVCDTAVGDSSEGATEFAAAIRAVLAGEEQIVLMEYPCHSPTEKRWFAGRVTRFPGDGPPRVVVAHENITGRKRTVEALRQSEERYRLLAETTRDIILLHDIEGLLHYVNQAGLDCGGLESGKPITDFIPAEFMEDVAVRQQARAAGDRATYLYETAFVNGEGRRIPVEINSSTIEFDGELLILVVARDTTERKRADEALRASEERYRYTLDNMLEGCQIIDHDWRYLYLNDAVARQGHQTIEQMLGHTIMEVYPGIKESALFAVLQRCMDERVPDHMVNEFTYSDGTSGWFELSIQPVPEGLFVLSNDITRRRQAEAALVHERDLLHTLMDNIPDSIYFKDAESRFTRINQAQARLLGCDTPEEALGKTDFDFYSSEFAREAFDDEQRIVKSGEPLVGKVEQIRWPNGQARWVSATKVPIRDNLGQVTGLVGITRDITNLKQAQEAEREQRALAEALADVAAKLNSTLDLEEVLEHILATVGRVARHDAANVMFIESGIAHVVRHQGRIELEDGEHLDWVIAETPTLSRMVESREPLAIPETQSSPLWIPTIRWVRSYAGAPIRLDEEVIGFISLNGATPNMFTADHAQRLQVFADQAAVAIKNAQLFGQTEQRATYLAALNDASHRVTRWGLDLDGVLQAIVTLLVERVGVAFARIWLADDAGEVLILRASAGLYTHLEGKHARLRIANYPGHVGQTARERKPTLLNQIQGSDLVDQKWAAKHGLVSFAGYPLRKNDHLVAVLAIFSTEPLDHALLDMLGSFANQAAIAIENARLYRELEVYSGTLEQAVAERTAELQQTKERVETILNYSPDPILLLKPDGAIEAANPAFKRVFGFDVDELHRQLPTSLVIPDHAKRMQAALLRAVEGHRVTRLELVARHQDGTTFDAGVALAPIQVGDTLLGVVCSVRDISALKEVERMKDAFVSNVSHELRTPITSLKLSHDLLEVDPAGREKYLGRLSREISRLDNLIEDLLRLSRLDQGRVELNLQPVDLNRLAAQYVNDRNPLAESQGLTLLFEKDSSLPPAQADDGLIGQVLSILLTNALNYTPAGGRVTVSTHEEKLDGSQWVGFSVSDTGPGITPDDQSHLFERFYRGQAGLGSGAPGTGLGLAIAKEIVGRHHGRIEVESEGVPCQGSRFTVWLPAST